MRRVLFIAASCVLAASMLLPAQSSMSSMFLPGGSYDRATDIAVDASGRAFLAISTQSRDYGQPRRLSPVEAWLPRTQAFVTRIDTDGTQTHWPITEASLGAIAIDAAGYIYVAGSRSVPGQAADAFLARLRPSGSVEYSVTFGGAADDLASGVAVDAAGNIFVVGSTTSPDFRSSRPGQPCRGSAPAGPDAFVVRIDPQGSIAESICLGGSAYDSAYGVALDPKGDLVVAGATRSADLPVTEGAYQSRSTDSPCVPKVQQCGDAFVAKLSSGELRVLWVTYLGGSARDMPEGFAVDAAGDIYITGSTTSRDLPRHDAVQQECLTAYVASDCGDAFIVKLAGSGSTLLFGSFIGGSAWETATGVAISPAGHIYVSGTTSSAILLDRRFEAPRQDTNSFLVVLDRANDVLDVRVINHGRNERMEGVAGGWPGILYMIGATDVAVPSGTPCCYSDRDAYVTTIR